MIADRAPALAHVVRGGVVESVHHGHLVTLGADGAPQMRHGDPDVEFYPRSALKPVQAVAMLRAGLELDGALLALACASHSGEPVHLGGVRRILGRAGLDERDLANTPGYPLDATAAATWRAAGREPSALAQNCSGKHAAMLATCAAVGWDTDGYRDPAHPLQQAIRSTVAELTGRAPAHVAVDGCGAPLFSTGLAGLARAFATIVGAPAGTPEHRVAAAMSGYPYQVGGTGRTVTDLMAAVPGLVCKDGAEGVCAAALPDGRALAVTVLDGAARPVPVLVAAVVRFWGLPVPDGIGRVEVLGGGAPVGQVRAVLPTAADPSP